MAIVLVICLIILIYGNYICSSKDYMAPAFIFSLTFCAAAIDCALYLPKWKTTISFSTVYIVLLGVCSFSLFSLLVYALVNRTKENRLTVPTDEAASDTPKYIHCPTNFSILFIILQVVVSASIVYCEVRMTAPYGTDGSIQSAISMYQHLSKFTTLNLRFPFIITYLFIFCSTSGYVWGYILAFNLSFFKKVDYLVVANMLLSCISGMLTGSRGNSLQMFVSTLVIFVFFQRMKTNDRRTRIKNLIRIGLIFVVLLLSFESLAGLMGRDNSLNVFDYISVYLGAPIKNLDLFVQKNHAFNGIFGSETFLQQINWFSRKLGHGNLQAINPQMTYLSGYNLGNVYTAFKAFYADFGYSGVVSCSAAMAVVMQALYEKIKVRKNIITNKNKINIFLILYAHLLFAMAFSFFSNKFYQTFTITFLERVFFWWLLAQMILYFNKPDYKIQIKKLRSTVSAQFRRVFSK